MSIQRKKFATQMDIEKLSILRDIAKREGRQLQVILEEAVEMYLKERLTYRMQPDVKEAYLNTLRRFPKTLKKLAE